MATTTATINLTSPDITGDPLNLSKTATLTKAGSNNVLMGRLYPGDWCFFPYDGTLDVDIDTSAVGMKVEYGVFSQSAAS